MSKRRKNRIANQPLPMQPPRTIEVHVENGFCGTVELVDHGDGTVSFAVPLPDHIDRWLDQFDLLPAGGRSDEAESSDGQSTVH